MKNTMKIMLALLTSVSLISNASAGELTVTGSAKATYNMISGGTSAARNRSSGKGIGVANEIDFGATGELENGWSWNYQVQFDPNSTAPNSTSADGNGQIDDSRLELTTTFGTLGVYVTEGGLDTDNANSQSVYGRPTDIGYSTGMGDGFDIGAFNNLQYHLPSGLLPFETTVKAGYASGQENLINSSNAVAAAGDDDFGRSAEQYQVTFVPIERLKVSADYYKESGAGTTTKPVVQAAESGSLGLTYAYGDASFGISRTLKAPLIVGTSSTASVITNTTGGGQTTDAIRQYSTNKMSAAYVLPNTGVSFSYEVEKSKRELIVNAAEYDIKSQAVQVAYTMGGMTLALSRAQHDNTSYAQNDDVEQTLFAMSMAF